MATIKQIKDTEGNVHDILSIIGYGTCATAAATAAKVATINDTSWTLKVGSVIGIKFTNTNTAGSTTTPVTLNVNNTGAKNIWYSTSKYTSTSGTVCGTKNRVIYYMYDGTYWVWMNSGALDGNSNTVPCIQIETAAATADKVGTCTNYSLLAKSYAHANVRYTNSAQSALTLNVNSKGAKPIYINGTASSASNYTLPAGTYIIYYDGTNYHFRTDGKLPNVDIPAVGNGKITIKQAGTEKGSFTVNQSGDTTIELTDTDTTYTSLKNPNSIKFKNTSGTEVTYDGSIEVDLTGGVYYATSAGSAEYAESCDRAIISDLAIGDENGNNIISTYVTRSDFGSLTDHVDRIESDFNGFTVFAEETFSKTMLSVTHSQLVNLRDKGKLIPGQQYRIKDYITTTVQEDTESAGHQFDIIVTANSNNTLSEIAGACLHEGDTYFSENGANLSAWQIWYCLDNDVDRFEWADSTNGKGVIYRMIDECGNDCPYDFKNIKFKKPIISETDTPDGNFYYTFCSYDGNSSNIKDASIIGNNYKVYNNVIKLYYVNNKQSLNRILFIGSNCYNNTFGDNCYSNTFGNYCNRNTFGTNCNSNTFGNYCYENKFGNHCRSNKFGNFCNNNTFGYNCLENIFGSYCGSNKFANNCVTNTFGDWCNSNTFGENCEYNKFGHYCSDNKLDNKCVGNILKGANKFNVGTYDGGGCTGNTFGLDCRHNILDNECNYNEFGDICGCTISDCIGHSVKYDDDGNMTVTINEECEGNVFGVGCESNTFGDYCKSNTFGYGCNGNTFGTNCESNTFGDWCKSNTFGNDCKSNIFGHYCTDNKLDNKCEGNILKGANKNNDGTYDADGGCIGNAFGLECRHNTLDSNCKYNEFGDSCGCTDSGCTGHTVEYDVNGNITVTINESCNGNVFGTNCQSNKFGIDCRDNTFGNNCQSNIFGNWCGELTLNGITYKGNEFKGGCKYNVFGDYCGENNFNTYCSKNTFGNECCSNTLGVNCISNILSNNCQSNKFGNNCDSNTFGNNCDSNKLYNNCDSNTFGNWCGASTLDGTTFEGNEFKDGCKYNLFGDYSRANKFSKNCSNNTFGNHCVGNEFGELCTSNNFKIGCNYNNFGERCESNIFDNYCNNNTLGSRCAHNIFGDNCASNTFGSNCYSNTFGVECIGNKFTLSENGEGIINGVSNMNFDNLCKNINLYYPDSTGVIKNYNINKGVSNKNILVEFINSDICVEVWISSLSREVVQEYINEHITNTDIDLIWDRYFSSGMYSASAASIDETINSIGIGDYDEEK